MILKGKLYVESPIYRGNARKTLFTRDGDGTLQRTKPHQSEARRANMFVEPAKPHYGAGHMT